MDILEDGNGNFLSFFFKAMLLSPARFGPSLASGNFHFSSQLKMTLFGLWLLQLVSLLFLGSRHTPWYISQVLSTTCSKIDVKPNRLVHSILHSILHSLHSILHSLHSILHSLHLILRHSLHSILHFAFDTALFTFDTTALFTFDTTLFAFDTTLYIRKMNEFQK